MARPTFIIGEPEAEQALSTRKLVIETAKFNVITAHSADEVMEMIDIFPKADAVILHDELAGSRTEGLIGEIRKQLPKTPLIWLNSGHSHPRGIDHRADTHDPEALLGLLRERFGDPRPAFRQKDRGAQGQ